MQEILRQIKTLDEMQRRLLPREVPQVPNWQLAVHYAVGRWPGGDYYDFLPLDDGRLIFMIGDASDEGGPAAALVAMVRVMMHSCPLNSGVERSPFCPLRPEAVQSPHIILGNLNRILVDNSLEEQYMTAFCGLLSPAEGSLHFANAGHPAPRWWHARTKSTEALRYAVGLPLGIDPRAAYHHKRIVIEPGDVLVLCTDGLTTAQNDTGDFFGTERLERAVADLAPEGAEAVKNGVVARLEDFLQEGPPQDDVALLVLERTA